MPGMTGTLTGEAATLYVAAWVRSAERGRSGLNGRRLAADALAARTQRNALSRLRLSTVKATVRFTLTARTRARRRPSRSRKPGQRLRLTRQGDPPRLDQAA